MVLSKLCRWLTVLTLTSFCLGVGATDTSVVTSDPYTGTVSVAAPKLTDSKIFAQRYWSWWLSSTTGANGTLSTISLAVAINAPDWLFLDRASDRSARQFVVAVVDRQLAYGGVDEIVSIALPADYLLAAVANSTQIQLQVRGKRGALELQLEPAYVAEFLRVHGVARMAAMTAVVAPGAPGAVTRRGSLGVRIVPVPATAAAALGLEEGLGLFVAQVTADSPAEKAGLKQGDVLVRFAGVDLRTPEQLQSAVASTNTVARLVVLRGGVKQEVEVSLNP